MRVTRSCSGDVAISYGIVDGVTTRNGPCHYCANEMATSLQRRRAPATPLPRRKRLRAPRPDESLVHHGVPGAESAIHYCLVSDLEAIIQDDENLVGVDAETSMPTLLFWCTISLSLNDDFSWKTRQIKTKQS